VGATQGCGECHSGAHQPFVEEWVQSRHGDAGRITFRTREGCASCHGGEGALQAWGVNTEYLEKGDPTANVGITCAVCHDPHDATNEGQLRFPIDVPNIDQNLCMKCHQRRAIPDENSSSGPHSPQGPLLLGEIGTVGWTPPNFGYNVSRIRGSHGSEANPRLCAGCHVNSYEVTDPATGAFVVTATGHLFKPIPCVDANGAPQADDSCAKTVEARSFNSCVSSGCHGDEDAALSALLLAQSRIEDLVTELNDLLALVPANQFSTADTLYTVGEGAKFNAGLGAIESSAVHNPFLTEALLTSSIKAVQDAYGLPLQSQITLTNIIGEPSGMKD
jgi:predicted CXXCH cytochrome family protein